MHIRKLQSLFFILFFFMASLFAVPAFAQQENEDAKRSLLPDIKSKNIEIRGEFVAHFPGLDRQPILGFNPTIRVYRFPDDRMPFIEPIDEAVTQLEMTQFSAATGPVYSPLQYSEFHNLFARVGWGSYMSPVVKAWGIFELNDNSYVGLDINFTSSGESYLANRPSTYRYLTGHLEYGVQLNENMDLYVYFGLQNDFNYAAQFSRTASTTDLTRINYKGSHAGFVLSNYKNEVTGWKLKGQVRNFSSVYELKSFTAKTDGSVYSGLFSYRWALGHPGETLTVKASGRGGRYQPESRSQQSWSTFYGGVVYERLFNYQTRLSAEADLYYVSNYKESRVYPGVEVTLSHWFGSRLKVAGHVEAKPSIRSFEQLYEYNRFIGYNQRIRHSYTVRVNGEASLKWLHGSKLYAGATYMNMTKRAYFLPGSKIVANGSTLDYYSIKYADATNMKIYAGIMQRLASNTFWVNAEFYLQNPTLSTNDKPVPFTESWGVNVSATYRPFDRVTIKGWTKYLGSRAAPASSSIDLDNIFLVGGQIDVRITDSIGAYIKVINLLDQEYQYWLGYAERPVQLYGGITVTL